MRAFTTGCIAVITLAMAGNVAALDLPLIDLRIGLRGGPTVNILPEVGEEDPIPVYPGFFGLGWSFGGSLLFDYLDIVGIEFGVLYATESMSGTVEFDRDLGTDLQKEETDFTLEGASIHLPLILRGQIPTGVVRPFLHLGVDFIVSRSSHALVLEQRGDAPAFVEGCNPGVDCDPFPARDYGVNAIDTWNSMLLGIGMDIDIGPVTVPIEARILVNGNFQNSIVDRTVVDPTQSPTFRYDNEWQYQAHILFGVNYRIF